LPKKGSKIRFQGPSGYSPKYQKYLDELEKGPKKKAPYHDFEYHPSLPYLHLNSKEYLSETLDPNYSSDFQHEGNALLHRSRQGQVVAPRSLPAHYIDFQEWWIKTQQYYQPQFPWLLSHEQQYIPVVPSSALGIPQHNPINLEDLSLYRINPSSSYDYADVGRDTPGNYHVLPDVDSQQKQQQEQTSNNNNNHLESSHLQEIDVNKILFYPVKKLAYNVPSGSEPYKPKPNNAGIRIQ